MALAFEIPGAERLQLEYLLLDVNGTLSDLGELIAGTDERIQRLSEAVEVRLLSADTFGSLDRISERLGIDAVRISWGDEKRAYVERLGAERCAAIGNGANDEAMLRAAQLGIAVIGPEGASAATLQAADVVFTSVLDALDLLSNPDAVASTLRR